MLYWTIFAPMDFELKKILPATPVVVYATWLNAEGHTQMTGASASIQSFNGSEFTAWDGYIWGRIIDLKAEWQITMRWRTTDFAEDQADSIVTIELSPCEEGTELTLTHENLKQEDTHYIDGWEKYYFTPMESYFKNLYQ